MANTRLVALLVSFALFAFQVRAGSLSEIFLMDCEGNVNILPSMSGVNARFNVPALPAIYTGMINTLYNRAKCACPSLSANDFLKLLSPTLDAGFNVMQGATADLSANCDLSQFADSGLSAFVYSNGRASPVSNLTITMPSTCTYANWRDNGVCAAKLPLGSTFDADLNIIVKKCPNSYLPFISVTCDGSGCNSIAKPCNSNNDCTTDNNKLECKPVRTGNDSHAWPSSDDIYDWLEGMLLVDDGDERPGCYSDQTWITTLLQKARSLFDSTTVTPTSTWNMCLPIAFGTVNDSEVVWEAMGFNNIQTTNSTDPATNETTVIAIDLVTPGILTSWNGIRVDNSDAASTARMTGQAFPAYNQIPAPINSDSNILAYASCAGDFWLAPLSAAGFYADFRGTLDVGNALLSQIKPTQDCRAVQRSGSSLTDSAYRVRYSSIPESLLYSFTSPSSSINYGPNMSDWHFEATSTSLNMPTTCSFATVDSTGQCAMSFTGFQSLFGMDVKINGFTQRCPGQYSPATYVECQGQGCGVLSGDFRPCTSNSDCSNDFTCQSVQSIIQSFNLTYESPTSQYDIIGSILFGSSSASQCQSLDMFYQDFGYIAASALGVTPSSASAAPSSFCFYDTTHIQAVVSTWGAGQAVTSGNKLTVSNLLTYSPPTTTVTTVNGQAGIVSIIYPAQPTTPSSASRLILPIASLIAMALALLF